MAANADRTYATGATALLNDTCLSHSPVATSAMALRVKAEGGFYGDVTGRLGYTWGPGLIYAKGGFAWLQESVHMSAAGTDIDLPVSSWWPPDTWSASHTFNDTLTGWTVGGGVEYMLNPNWTMKVEYLHFDFADSNTWNDIQFTHGDLTIDTVKLGFNYLLGHGYAPLK